MEDIKTSKFIDPLALSQLKNPGVQKLPAITEEQRKAESTDMRNTNCAEVGLQGGFPW